MTQAGTLGITRYSDSGALKTTVLGQVTTDTQYNAFAELQRSIASYQGTPFYSQDITERDNLGRIKHLIEIVNGIITEYDYHYDAAGRLEVVLENGVETARYRYDSNGNRLQYNNVRASYDDQDRLLTYGNNQYTYSANGELESKITPQGMTRYEYDLLGNLQQVVLPDGRVIDYLTDAKGRRIGKKINGVLVQGWLYNGQLSPVAELDGKGQIVARFVYADRANIPSYLLRNNKTYRIIANHLGNPRVVMDTATGEMVQQMNFDEFGRVMLDTNPGFQPFGFAGGLYDGDTGLVRFGARDYDAETGRWTAKDPIRFEGGDTNLYGYVLNDPVNWVDRSGLVRGVTYPTPNQAALAGIAYALQHPNQSIEHGGWVFATDNGFQHTDIVSGDNDHIPQSQLQKLIKNISPEDIMADFHTHPETSGYSPEEMSPGDMDSAVWWGLPGYIKLRDGDIVRIDPNGDVILVKDNWGRRENNCGGKKKHYGSPFK